MNERIVVIVQARMGSGRFPGKIFQDINGRHMLGRVVDRLRRARMPDEVIVATSTLEKDDAVAKFCDVEDLKYYRGSEADVLARYYEAAKYFKADVVVRCCGDCPLIDPALSDCVIATYLSRQPELDYCSNIMPPQTFPEGLHTEAIKFSALERAYREAKAPREREHVTPYIKENPAKFSIHAVANDKDLYGMRWAVNELDDLERIRSIYSKMGREDFTWLEVVRALENDG